MILMIGHTIHCGVVFHMHTVGHRLSLSLEILSCLERQITSGILGSVAAAKGNLLLRMRSENIKNHDIT